MTVSTQIKHPWRTTVRTAFQTFVGVAALAGPVYAAATHKDPALAVGLAGAVIVVASTVTKIMAMPSVEAFIAKFLPFLATQPAKVSATTVGNTDVKVTTTPPVK